MAKKPQSTETQPESAAEAKPPGTRRFRVHLSAGTPLAVNPAEVEADSDLAAWEKFCDLNGISGSTCQREITEIKE